MEIRGGHISHCTLRAILIIGNGLHMLRAGRFPLLMQEMVDESCHCTIEHGKERNTDDPAGNPPQAAEEHNREDYPEIGQAGGISQNLRSEDVSVKGLQHQTQQHKPQCIQRIDHEYNDTADHRTDKGSEKRDHVCKAYDERCQHREGCMRDEFRCKEAEDSDDEGVQNLPREKSYKGAVDVAAGSHDLVAPFLIKKSIGNLLPLSAERVLGIHEINGHDNADDEIEHSPADGVSLAGSPLQNVRQIRGNVLLIKILQKILGVDDHTVDLCSDLRIHLGNLIKEPQHISLVDRQIAEDRLNAARKLGQDNGQHSGQQCDEECNGDAHRYLPHLHPLPAPLRRPDIHTVMLIYRSQHPLLHKCHHRVQNERDHNAVENGLQTVHDGLKCLQKGTAVVNQVNENNTGNQRQKRSDPPCDLCTAGTILHTEDSSENVFQKLYSEVVSE